MKYFITYGDEVFKKQKKFTINMAKQYGKFDIAIGYDKNQIDEKFYSENIKILKQSKGSGYWLWKPYYINRTLEIANYGDYIFYCDAGAFFLKEVQRLIDEMNRRNQDIMGFELPLIERQWTKKDLFINMQCDFESIKDSNQLLASFILLKKTKFTLYFFKEFLNYACNEINLTDVKSESLEEDVKFLAHRHDQSIFSLLYKKHNLIPFKDPSQHGDSPYLYAGQDISKFEKNIVHILSNGKMYRQKIYTESYNNVIYHNRRSNPILSLIKHFVLKWSNKLIK